MLILKAKTSFRPYMFRILIIDSYNHIIMIIIIIIRKRLFLYMYSLIFLVLFDLGMQLNLWMWLILIVILLSRLVNATIMIHRDIIDRGDMQRQSANSVRAKERNDKWFFLSLSTRTALAPALARDSLTRNSLSLSRPSWQASGWHVSSIYNISMLW